MPLATQPTLKTSPSAAAAAAFYGSVFGDGSDGAVNLDGTNTYSGFATKSGSTYTLTRDVFATSLTIASGVTVVAPGWRLFATGTLTNNGTVRNDGNPGNANGTGATALTSGGLGVLSAGGTGNTGAGTAPSGTYLNAGVGSGSAGGAGASGAGGNQQFSAFTATPYMLRNPVAALIGAVTWGSTVARPLAGGGSGGGGGGDGTNKGGGGGTGGGILGLFAKQIINTGTLSVKGGDGGTPTTGNCGGGGAGGGGVILAYSATPWTNTGTTVVTPGSPGAGVGTGATPSTAGSGTVNNFVLA